VFAIKNSSVLFPFSSTQLAEAKADSEKFVRRCAEGVAIRVERLVQALREATRKQVDSLETPQYHVLCKLEHSVKLATNLGCAYLQYSMHAPDDRRPPPPPTLSAFQPHLALRCLSNYFSLRHRLELWRRNPRGPGIKKSRTRCCELFRYINCSHVSICYGTLPVGLPRSAQSMFRRLICTKSPAVLPMALSLRRHKFSSCSVLFCSASEGHIGDPSRWPWCHRAILPERWECDWRPIGR